VPLQTDVHQSVKHTLIVAMFLGGVVFVLFYFTCLLVGKCYLNYDSTFSEFYLCRSPTAEPVPTVSKREEQLYICGKIEGTTPRPGGLYLFRNGVVVLNTHFEQKPGSFIEPLPMPSELQPGRYRIEIGYAKRMLATTEFEVTEN